MSEKNGNDEIDESDDQEISGTEEGDGQNDNEDSNAETLDEDSALEEVDAAAEGVTEDDGVPKDLSYYVDKIAKTLENKEKEEYAVDDASFSSYSDGDENTAAKPEGETLKPAHQSSLQNTVKKSSSYHERELKLFKTVCFSPYKRFIDIGSIGDFKNLRCVDFGGNHIRDFSTFSALPFLGTIKLYNNGIYSISSLKSKSCRFLDLSRNKIKSLDGSQLPGLSRLKLNYNRIRTLEFLKGQEMKWLRKLELRGNRLRTTAGIKHPLLEELYLAENDIREIEDFEECPNLRRLHLRDNQIIEVTGFSRKSTKLEYVNLRNNLITFIDDAVGVCVLPKVKSVIMLDNPVQLEEDFRMVMVARMPMLKWLDKEEIQQYDRDWHIMTLLDCLHHEEVDLMVAVSDLMESISPMETQEPDMFLDEKSLTGGSKTSDHSDSEEEHHGNDPDYNVPVKSDSNAVEDPETSEDDDDDLKREYWGDHQREEETDFDGESENGADNG